jgi:hypothetical protein
MYKHVYPRREKLIFIIGLGLESEYLTAKIISEYFRCTVRSANRLMNTLYDMQHELKYLVIEKSGRCIEGDEKKIRIRLNRSWL